MTGMGHDGAKGLLAMRTAGAFTVAQDEKSSVVYGMAKEAVRYDAVDEIVPLSGIASMILESVQK
jgi:two-component system chemotaxis response regulator CheB